MSLQLSCHLFTLQPLLLMYRPLSQEVQFSRPLLLVQVPCMLAWLQHHSLVPLQLVGSRLRPCVGEQQLLLHRAFMGHNAKV